MDCPSSVHDFRPIACCNVMYKCISKIICSRLSSSMDVVSMNQSAFIKDREIVDNILICQDLVRLYGRKTCTPRTMLKIDLKKAYDSIEWAFLREMLVALEFPEKMVQWIMVCVSTPSFTISLNGSQFGYFKGKRGLRQGDPMSPLLFTLCLEYFSRILRVVTEKPEFRLAGFKLGQFPFRYLGVPISYKRLSVADCSRVVDKIVARIRGWGAKHLSYAGRLVLVKAVLTRLHVYWARIFSLPKGVIHKVESICRNYLWAGTAEYKHSPPVAWETAAYQRSMWAWRQISKIKELLKPGFLNGAWDGNYTIQKGYTWLLGPCQKKDWAPIVWNRVCVPKHNFSTLDFCSTKILNSR
ncbi:uncharacterized protein LOC141587931 [Silene latifolia]|uniref:uncharacterized protein LOC141587931 n=1 Tax=Silene latifolia TaxID=37657 RepID=UPI003D772B4C